MFMLLWYNGNTKNHLGAELEARVRWEKIWSLDYDHNLDHPRLRTTWKQCDGEHPKALISDTKAPKSLVNQGKKSVYISLGARCRRFKSYHSDKK